MWSYRLRDRHKEGCAREASLTPRGRAQIDMSLLRMLKSYSTSLPQLYPGGMEVSKNVGSHHCFLSEFFSGEIPGQSMEINGKTQPFDQRSKMFLCNNAGNHTGEDIARTSGRHTGVSRNVDVNRPIRR